MSLQRLRLRLRTLGCASFEHVARPPRSRRGRPGRKALLLDLPGDLSGYLTLFLIVDLWRHFLSVLKSVCAVELPHRVAFRREEERDEKREKERRDQERSRLLIERRNSHRVILFDIPCYLSGQRVIEASGIDFAGNVVIPELPPMPVATTPAVLPANIV